MIAWWCIITWEGAHFAYLVFLFSFLFFWMCDVG
jgi:hypothetical protein